MIKQVLASIAVTALTITTPVKSQDSPLSSEQARQIEALVNKAATLVESQGRSAFPEFRKRNSEWWFDNSYLFACDRNLNVT